MDQSDWDPALPPRLSFVVRAGLHGSVFFRLAQQHVGQDKVGLVEDRWRLVSEDGTARPLFDDELDEDRDLWFVSLLSSSLELDIE